MSPEYAMEGIFSPKSDVFSFGVLLLEIISGKKSLSHYYNNPEANLLELVRVIPDPNSNSNSNPSYLDCNYKYRICILIYRFGVITMKTNLLNYWINV